MRSFIKFTFKAVITLAALALIAYFGWKYAIPKLDRKDSSEKEFYIVKKVNDGDTFEVEISGRTERVRMLGIDTPERFESDKLTRDIERTGRDKETIKKLGELASGYTTSLIGGKMVTLAAEPNGDDKDKYGRLLRYVYLEDGTFVNKKIVEDGYANAYRRFNLSKQKEFIEAENQAREKKKGLWGDIDGLKYFENRDK